MKAIITGLIVVVSLTKTAIAMDIESSQQSPGSFKKKSSNTFNLINNEDIIMIDLPKQKIFSSNDISLINNFSRFLKEDVINIRNTLNLTQLRFPILLGISVRTLIRWERGDALPQFNSFSMLNIAKIHPELFLLNTIVETNIEKLTSIRTKLGMSQDTFSLLCGVKKRRCCTKENEDTSLFILAKTLCNTSSFGYTKGTHPI